MNKIRYLIFDLDGTLIDSSGGVVDAVNYSLRMTHQPEQPPDRIKSFIGFPLETMYPEFTDVPVAELYPHFQARAAQVMVKSTLALQGAEAALVALKEAGFRMAVATTKISRHARGAVAKLGWSAFFEVTVGADDVKRVKPAPDAFEKAVTRLDGRPSEAMAIGDTVNDIAAARAVPMRSVAVRSPYRESDEMLALKPDYYIQSVAELPALLQALAGGKSPAG